MSTKTKIKVAIRVGILLFCSFLLINIIVVLTRPVLIVLNGEKEVSICYGEEYEDMGASPKYDFLKLKTSSNVDTSKVGEYEVRYSLLTENLVRKVHVVDEIRPEVSLNGLSKIYLAVGEKYEEAGASAYDEIDGDLSGSIEIDSSELDLSKEGKYYISYIARDKAGNATRERREINVVKKSPLTMGQLEFNLLPYYEDVVCKEVPYDSAKYKDIMFFGDSFIGNLGAYGAVPFSQIWTRPSISTDDIYSTTLYIRGYFDNSTTFFQAMNTYKPKTVLVLCNCDWTGRWTVDYLANSCDKAFAKMAEYKDTQFVICSLMPLDIIFNDPDSLRNVNVDKMNAKMCELCRKYGFKFMNAAEAVKNPRTGACYDEYISTDYIHLSVDGCFEIVKYIKSHMDW